MRCNISELQPQILPTDGHFGPSFARTRHWIDLEKQVKKKENSQTTCVKTLASSQAKEEAVSGLFATTRDNRNSECQTVEGPSLFQIHHLAQLPWKYISHMPQPRCIQNSAPDLIYSLWLLAKHPEMSRRCFLGRGRVFWWGSWALHFKDMSHGKAERGTVERKGRKNKKRTHMASPVTLNPKLPA